MQLRQWFAESVNCKIPIPTRELGKLAYRLLSDRRCAGNGCQLVYQVGRLTEGDRPAYARD